MATSPSLPSPGDIVTYLTGIGYSPVQAAAITGNIEQESGFNPNSLNQKEGAYGLLQWRGPRLDALKSFAQSQGADPSDWRTQLSFARQEMSGPESKNSTGFLNASSLPQANASLKNYIRYGDDSEGRRLSNAQNYLPAQYASINAPPLTPGSQAPGLPPPINVGSLPAPQAQAPFLPAAAQPQDKPPTATAPQPQGLLAQIPAGSQINAPPIFYAPRRPIDLSGLQAALQASGNRGFFFRG